MSAHVKRAELATTPSCDDGTREHGNTTTQDAQDSRDRLIERELNRGDEHSERLMPSRPGAHDHGLPGGLAAVGVGFNAAAQRLIVHRMGDNRTTPDKRHIAKREPGRFREASERDSLVRWGNVPLKSRAFRLAVAVLSFPERTLAETGDGYSCVSTSVGA